MYLLIDNYDSFTYNVVHYLAAIGVETIVKRNDEITLEEIEQLNPKAIVISPGPCDPDKAGICLAMIERFKEQFPIFGICLGHQAIAQSFGAKIIKAPVPVHGKIAEIYHEEKGVFNGLPSPFPATRYHSLIIDRESLSDDFEITAQTKDGIIMAIKHKTLPIESVQFHPESVGTEGGKEMLKNFDLSISN
jgi:anthranilate synthase/aminodeoxychorismate synthase-like glutamine amidotransferase